jgi:hypothetical protein
MDWVTIESLLPLMRNMLSLLFMSLKCAAALSLVPVLSLKFMRESFSVGKQPVIFLKHTQKSILPKAYSVVTPPRRMVKG